MDRSNRQIVLLSALLLAGASGAVRAQEGAAAAPASTEPGVWQPQKVELTYVGFTSLYSCDGLQGKLELLLRQFGARPGFKVITYGCPDGYGHPDRFVRARLEFDSLSPASAGSATVAADASRAPVQGAWRKLDLQPQRPFDLQRGDCELIEQFRQTVLPLFTTRDQQIQTTCVPFQDTGSPFDVKLQVFAPAPVPRTPGGH